MVSGLIALLLEVKPELSNDDVKCLLITSAQPALSRDGRLAYSPFIQGNGRVDGARALTVGDMDCDQKSLNIGAAVTGRETLYGPAEMLPDGSPTLPGYATMVQDTPANGGFSDDRRWGVAAHLQRLDAATEAPQAEGVPSRLGCRIPHGAAETEGAQGWRNRRPGIRKQGIARPRAPTPFG